MEQEEVDDVAERQAIPQIARRAAEDQRQAGAIQAVAAAPQEPDDEAAGGNRDGGEEIPRPARDVAEKAERGARVECEHEAEEIGHDALLPRLEERDHGELRELIGGDDGTAQSEPRPPARRLSHASLARASREGARLAGAEEVGHTAPAKSRVHRVAADIRAVVPAALALAVCAPGHAYQALGPRRDARGGSDQHEPKIVAQARQRLVLAGGRHDVDFRLE